MRGAISVAFLERIETIFAEHQRKLLTDYIAAKERAGINDENLAAARQEAPAPFRLADWFDLVGGTSTGSLIAGAVALGFNTDDIKNFYIERAPFMFQRPFWRIPGLQAKFDARALAAGDRHDRRAAARSTATSSSPGCRSWPSAWTPAARGS